ncbi:Kinesin-4 [Acorus gramineus]|uniref:Kinesin-4 n=1 Tax=Acorus gramineus TaxID=55184 RepID=A0AAV9BPH1_ACOGR|nr:Kinesin-4 [Acorus gramineus]
MAGSGGLFTISVASVVEDVLRQHGTRLSDLDLASRKAEEAASRRYEAAGWLRKTVGVVCAKDLPEEPTEEEFRLGLRSGRILCNALNRVHPGAVPKVVESPVDSVVVPDGAALSAYQYFENVRNFLVAVQEMGLPTFEASDLEQGGKGSRVVNCVLALKSYSDWKEMGGNGSWKYGGGALKATSSGKFFVRKNSEPFMNTLSRNPSMNEKLQDTASAEQYFNGDHLQESNEMSLSMLIRAVLGGKKPEEVPALIESMLSKVTEEFERRIANQNEQVQAALKDVITPDGIKSFKKPNACGALPATSRDMKDELTCESLITKEQSKSQLKQHKLLEQQERDIQELKNVVHTAKAGVHFLQMKYSEDLCNLGKHLHGLANAASGYHRVLEENRKLYNQVQDLKGNIRVYCRVRPFLPGQSNCVSTVSHIDDESITIFAPSMYGKEYRRAFSFNKVFGPFVTQDEVFLDTQPLIRSVLDGYNVCIFAYGQTGSGKTFTMSGPREFTEQSRGVNYRALSDLFDLSEQRRDNFSYDVSVQMIEIYNEQVRDLLVNDGLNKRLEIHSSSQRGFNVPDANLVPVASTSEVIELMNIGQKNRAVGATALNDRSSRSHSCLTVHVQGRDLTSGTVLRGCMHLVDLAGSERVDKSEVTGERLKEAQHINKSLSALGDVIAALAQKNSHVPYRNSKLTQLLQDSLGGQAKTLMFVHISPEVDAIGETISTLKFAERVATVELGAARLNKESGEVKELKEQIAKLKAALARKEGGNEYLQNSLTSPDIYRSKSGIPSPAHTNRFGDIGHITQRQPMEDVGNIEVRSNSVVKQKRPSFDLQELLMATDSPPWPDSNHLQNFPKGDDDKEMGFGDWIDKTVVNKQESLIRGQNDPLRDWQGNGTQLPEFFYQSYLPDQLCGRDATGRKEGHDFDIQRSRFESASTDGSDELEIATSDSSEADMLWQYNLPRVTATVNGGVPRSKKPVPKPGRSPDIRTPNQAVHGPSPSRKFLNGSSGQALSRTGRQQNSNGVDGKRFTSSSSKMGNGK